MGANTSDYMRRRNSRIVKRKSKRKYKKYIPNSRFLEFIEPESHYYHFGEIRRGNRTILKAPINFSLHENRVETLEFFHLVRQSIPLNELFIIDMHNTSNVDLPTVSILIALMMSDREDGVKFRNNFILRQPRTFSPAHKIFADTQFGETVTGKQSNTKFLSRTDTIVNQKHAEDLLNRTRDFLGSQKQPPKLWPILLEITKNTINHADVVDSDIKTPWLATTLRIDDNTLSFCILDLGIGIYRSLERKNSLGVKSGKVKQQIYKTFFREDLPQSELLSKRIPEGINSSTGLDYRGKGLKDIYENVATVPGAFRKFVIITNKAMVDIININDIAADSDSGFLGTLYYMEISNDYSIN